MPTLNRYLLEDEINSIRSFLSRFETIPTDINFTSDKILNLGCSSGTETLALMWKFGSKETTGVDKNISGAKSRISRLRDLLKESNEAVKCPFISSKDLLWWNNQVPEFLKRYIFPNFIEADIVDSLPLPSSSIDIAYCSNVLYQIFDKQGKNKGVLSALSNIINVLKIGGHIICDEPDKYNFRELFIKVGLLEVTLIPEKPKTLYIYRKR